MQNKLKYFVVVSIFCAVFYTVSGYEETVVNTVKLDAIDDEIKKGNERWLEIAVSVNDKGDYLTEYLAGILSDNKQKGEVRRDAALALSEIRTSKSMLVLLKNIDFTYDKPGHKSLDNMAELQPCLMALRDPKSNGQVIQLIFDNVQILNTKPKKYWASNLLTIQYSKKLISKILEERVKINKSKITTEKLKDNLIFEELIKLIRRK